MKLIIERLSPQQYIVKLLLILAVFIGCYLVVAWSSYSPFDNSWSVANSYEYTINKAGFLGAWIIDLLFTFLGYSGNLIPFLMVFIPIYILLNGSENITKLKIALGGVGLILFLSGVSVILTIYFTTSYSDIEHYLSGGVLGSFLVSYFYTILGKFGLLFFSTIFIIIGFLLCSGISMINLLVRFYHWLIMKNDDLSIQEENETDLALKNDGNINKTTELEEIIFYNPKHLQQNEQKASDNLVDVNQFININGLRNKEQPKEQDLTTDINASVSVIPDIPDNLVQQKNIDLVPPAIDNIGDLDFSHNTTEEVLPKVRILPSQERELLNKSVSEVDNIQNIIDDIEEDNHLALEFAQLEEQRLQQMAKRAKEINAEDAFNRIVNESQDLMADTSIPTDEDKNKVVNYASYKDTLIHPALQQKAVTNAKPTTPMPSLDLLEDRPVEAHTITKEEILETSQRIEQQLRNFNVKANVRDVLVGPVVTRYELELQPGVKASKVTNIDTDLSRALMFRSIRVAEVIPGKPYIGIETPNTHRQTVPLKDVLDSDEFRNANSLLTMALGKDISGKPVVVDLAKMPHLLVAGATGSGKSVGVNTMILSLLFRVKPEQVKFIMIDPKVVELSIYNDIPHLLTEVVTDMKKAANALRWCVDEMERRYQLLSALRVRNIEGFNDKIDEYNALGMPIPNPVWKPGDTMDTLPPALEKLSYIVVIVDEFADLMMVAGKQVEELIARLAQKARAIGIHLILATQRPSVDVITGLIKANIPSRIAFTVASKIDSRTILDQAGAEALLGRGDMLYSGQGSSELIRVHGAFMSDDEVAKIADDWRARGKPDYIDNILESTEDDTDENLGFGESSDEVDDLFDQVVEFVTSTGTTSTSAVQRRFRVGFNRAARIMEQLEEQGIVSEMQNGKREILSRTYTDY
ncbi:DNA translocase FtsK [Bisgaardia hudsonensis]|uniref:DNA translocase FtsK n=1 Tax=Bisgaardia hudsonensis TaxID=109472 RepID=A0A4R2N1T7_9PAST|nr:DNA translocase FtsK [Bisgaardia hudsonensis]QLB12946.1 cell division protein FtsK [Bisgaardia hudsonensis]TCP13493.1 DNA translocase FtsK [Bisgaardia hudsonensis]